MISGKYNLKSESGFCNFLFEMTELTGAGYQFEFDTL